MFDPRVVVAAQALPKLNAFVCVKAIEWLNSSAEVEYHDEEFFYNPVTGSVFVAVTVHCNLKGTSKDVTKSFAARIPVLGDVSVINADELGDMDLEDITHLVPEILERMKQNIKSVEYLKSVLQYSKVLLTMTDEAI